MKASNISYQSSTAPSATTSSTFVTLTTSQVSTLTTPVTHAQQAACQPSHTSMVMRVNLCTEDTKSNNWLNTQHM